MKHGEAGRFPLTNILNLTFTAFNLFACIEKHFRKFRRLGIYKYYFAFDLAISLKQIKSVTN